MRLNDYLKLFFFLQTELVFVLWNIHYKGIHGDLNGFIICLSQSQVTGRHLVLSSDYDLPQVLSPSCALCSSQPCCLCTNRDPSSLAILPCTQPGLSRSFSRSGVRFPFAAQGCRADELMLCVNPAPPSPCQNKNPQELKARIFWFKFIVGLREHISVSCAMEGSLQAGGWRPLKEVLVSCHVGTSG
jgi:hypothetical protein